MVLGELVTGATSFLLWRRCLGCCWGSAGRIDGRVLVGGATRGSGVQSSSFPLSGAYAGVMLIFPWFFKRNVSLEIYGHEFK